MRLSWRGLLTSVRGYLLGALSGVLVVLIGLALPDLLMFHTFWGPDVFTAMFVVPIAAVTYPLFAMRAQPGRRHRAFFIAVTLVASATFDLPLSIAAWAPQFSFAPPTLILTPLVALTVLSGVWRHRLGTPSP
jgi:hypothetical protein